MKKGLHRCKPFSYWWVVADLNRGPKDYEASQYVTDSLFINALHHPQ